VLSIAKLRVGQEAYQLSGVAQSLDDYYTGAGEAAGLWIGAGAERLGLAGEVDPDDLRAVLAGLAPGSGGLTPDGTTVRTHARRVPGFDLTFKTPKSVSVLYAVSDDPRVQGAIIEAGETAVREALAWLEREAIRVRRGSGDIAYLNDLAARDPAAADAARIRVLPGRGVVAATFRHRTSRAGDPLLHWHTLVANLVEGPDGRWGAFVHPELYRAVRAAGELFQAVLRGELTERLGLQWRAGRHVPEIAGVPQTLCDQFSKRAAEVDAWLAATGTPDDPAGRQAAVLATRRDKPEAEHERFDAAWKTEAHAAGWGPGHADALIASTTERHTPAIDEVWRLPTREPHSGAVADRAVDPEEWIAAVARTLTEHDSTFTRPDLVQAVAARIGGGATAHTIDRITARVLASAQLVPVAGDGPSTWTTAELLEVERRFLDRAASTRHTRAAIDPHHVEGVLGRLPTLGADQETAVRMLAASSDAISVMVGPAGTGKTFTLDAVRQVYTAAGYQVIGAAPSAKAAHELEADAHIASATIHRRLGSWTRGYEHPDAHTLLVVDEAAMAGLRDLDRLTATVVEAGGRVLLVGDHHQLPEVTAGGGFAALATDPAATVAELSVNRRQDHDWERQALAELRDGHVARAVAAYQAHGRVIVASGRPAMIGEAVDRWLAAHHAGTVPVLLAGTNQTVDALNAAVRRALIDRGVLGPAIDGSNGSLALGERLVIRANDYRAATPTGGQTSVLNGQTGTLTGTCSAGLVLRMDHDNLDVVLTPDQLATDAVGYAYASTAHRAQGGTWDLAITVGLDGLYREAGYLVMSRGRASNWLIVTAPELDGIDHDLARHDSLIPLPGEQPDTDHELLGRLTNSRRKDLALTQDPHAQAIQQAATSLDLATLEGWAAHARTVEAHATHLVGHDPKVLLDRLARTEHTARHAAVGQTVKAFDRRNIGTVTALDDTAGTLQVTFVAADGRTATRTLGWGDTQIVEPRHPEPRRLTPTATTTLDRLTADAHRQLERWTQHLTAHGVQPADRHIYEHAARLAVDRARHRLAAEQPDWLASLLGPRPTGRPAAVQVWDDAVRDLAAHRLRHRIDDPARSTGPDHTDPVDRAVWERAAGSLISARVWLDTHTSAPSMPTTRTRSRHELDARRDHLDGVLATAPTDHRSLIDRLRRGGTLDPDDTTRLLEDALATQGDRRRWILEHWPHVVEYAQINHALARRHVGPDVEPLLDQFAGSSRPALVNAAAGREPWLLTLAAQLQPPGVSHVDQASEQLLADIADHRARWAITHRTPLGVGATDADQAVERAALIDAVDEAVHYARSVDDDTWTFEPDPEARQLTLDDGLGL